MRKHIAYVLVIIGILGFLFTLYVNSKYADLTRTFSPKTLLAASWIRYKDQFINQDGRVIDNSQEDFTTSEGQSYALLRAVWIDDRESFNRIWTWTKQNLKRDEDNLFGWRWGKIEGKNYGFLPNGGINSASDADTDIALSLILASRRWENPSYQTESLEILKDIWDKETQEVGGRRYLIAGNWAKNEDTLIINPSYFAPYAWKIFAEVDQENDWNSLIDPAYELLDRSGREKLDRPRGVGLPPDWMSLNRKNGEIKEAGLKGMNTTYSYDALRVPWRIALDWQWNKDEKARVYLSAAFNKLIDHLHKDGKLVESYSHEGEELSEKESPALYATSLGFLSVKNPDLAKKIYEEKIIKLYSNDEDSFNQELPYYEKNWLWFGVALYNGQLPKL
ncbi:hypothetical protein HYW42_05340 [Candidatus Daviesbacteria bacterium]|nr:hypothetical protein [Candidatus Daviesbacteria bacterium]